MTAQQPETDCIHLPVCKYSGCSEKHCEYYTRPHTPAPEVERKFTLQEMIRGEKECDERVRIERQQERERVLEGLIKKIDACIGSCPSDAKQKPKTMLRYFRKTCESLRQQEEP